MRNKIKSEEIPIEEVEGEIFDTALDKALRRLRDSNPRYSFPYTHFPGVLLQPLGQVSKKIANLQHHSKTFSICILREPLMSICAFSMCCLCIHSLTCKALS